jgi:hypothetical protein
MTLLDDHRRAPAENLEVLLLAPPFSFFDLIEKRFGDYDSIRRIFALSRSFNAKMMIIEDIPRLGIISEENEDISASYSEYHNEKLVRISFWTKTTNQSMVSHLTNTDLVGYAILKHDMISTIKYDRWHVFESVFVKYKHKHNCVPRPMKYRLVIGTQPFEIYGLLKKLKEIKGVRPL